MRHSEECLPDRGVCSVDTRMKPVLLGRRFAHDQLRIMIDKTKYPNVLIDKKMN